MAQIEKIKLLVDSRDYEKLEVISEFTNESINSQIKNAIKLYLAHFSEVDAIMTVIYELRNKLSEALDKLKEDEKW